MARRSLKNQKGFTLVEVIVVAVIVAVLAAVAIPLYMGYIKDSRINVGDNIAGTISSAAGASTQQGVDFSAQVAKSGTKSTTAAPVTITFTGLNGQDNTVVIPDGYTLNWVDATPGKPTPPGTVECYYDDYGAGKGSKTFTYKK